MPISRRKRHARKRPVKRPRRTRRSRFLRRKRPARTHATLNSRPGGGLIRQPFPPNLWTTLTYSENFTMIQTVSGTPQIYTWRANSIYDPNYSGGGGQPRYYDSLLGANNGTAPYNNYRVHAAKFKLTCFPTSTSATNANAWVALIPRRSTLSSPSTLAEMRERAYSRNKFMGVLYVKPQTISNYVKVKTHLGHKDLSDVDDSAAAYNANPNEEVHMDIALCAIDSSTGVVTCTMSLTITYFVQLYTLNDVADS